MPEESNDNLDNNNKTTENEEQLKAKGEEGKKAEGDDKSSNKPTESEAKLLRDVMKWKDKARTTEEQLGGLKGELSKFQEALGDLDVDEVKQLIEAKKTAEKEELEKKGEYERLTERMNKEHQKQLDAATEELNTVKSQLEAANAQIEELTLGNSFANSRFVREESTLPPSIARTTFGAYFEREDGKIVGYDKPRGEKNRTPIVDSKGEPKSFDEALQEIYTIHPDSETLFKSKRKPGANSQSDANANKQPSTDGKKGVELISSILSKQGSSN